MDAMLLLLLGIAIIAVAVLVADVVMRRVGVDGALRWLVDLIVLIVVLLLVWPRVGW